MSAYCSQSDLSLRFGQSELIQLTDKDGESGAVNTSVLSRVIVDASAEIDAYLADGGYALPLSSTPQVVVRYCCDIARYYLYDDSRPDVVEQGYTRAMSWLEKISSGAMSLPGTDRDIALALDTPVVSARTQVFDSDFDSEYTTE